jgi:hypothetical protein
MKTIIKSLISSIGLVLGIVSLLSIGNNASAQQSAPEPNIKVENYYKLKWGHAEEFIALWKKNHYPLLKKLKEKGDVISIEAQAPTLHSSEETRWDYKVILVFKNAHLALDYSIVDPFKKQLFPNQETYKKEEQQRWELVVAHWDVLVEDVPLN